MFACKARDAVTALSEIDAVIANKAYDAVLAFKAREAVTALVAIDADVALAAFKAKDAVTALVAIDAEVALLAQLEVPNNEPVIPAPVTTKLPEIAAEPVNISVSTLAENIDPVPVMLTDPVTPSDPVI